MMISWADRYAEMRSRTRGAVVCSSGARGADARGGAACTRPAGQTLPPISLSQIIYVRTHYQGTYSAHSIEVSVDDAALGVQRHLWRMSRIRRSRGCRQRRLQGKNSGKSERRRKAELERYAEPEPYLNSKR